MCPHCGHRFVQNLPDVSAAEAEQLKADDNDKGVVFICQTCLESVRQIAVVRPN